MLRRQRRAAVEALLALRHVEGGVAVEEVDGLERHLEHLARHDREVLDARHVVDAELHKEQNVRVQSRLRAVGPAAHAGATARLVGVQTTGEEVLSDRRQRCVVLDEVDIAVGKLGASVVEGLLVGDHLLEIGRHDLVGDGQPVDGVADGGVLDLEDTVVGGVEVKSTAGCYRRLSGVVAVAVRVEVAAWHGQRFGVDETVGVTLDRRVDTQREDVLVVSCKDTWVHNGTPRNSQALVNGLGRQDTGSAHLVHELGGLVELECKDVLIVGNGDDGLQNQLALADNGGAPCAVVCVLPTNTSVLLVNADHIGHINGVSLVIAQDRVEIVDTSQAVASKLEVVGHHASTRVTQVKGRLLVVGVARVCVGDVHVRQRQAVEQGAAIVSHIVEDHALALVEAHPEVPLLPVDDGRGSLVFNGETGALGLDDLEWLDIRTQVLGLGNVLVCGVDLDRTDRLDSVVGAGGEGVDPDHFQCVGADDGGDGEG